MKNIDFSGGCSVTDTAEYSFILRNDSLLFTYIDDACYSGYLTIALYDWVDISTGIQFNKAAHNLNVYPNPTMNVINIEFSMEKGPGTYRIIDMNGRQLMIGKLEDEHSTVELMLLPKGAYILQLQRKDGYSSYVKIFHN